MEAIQRAIEPQQNAILSFSKLAAKLEGTNLAEANSSLADFRKSDKELRDRLYVLQVWRKFDYQMAHKLQMKKAGEFEDPDLVGRRPRKKTGERHKGHVTPRRRRRLRQTTTSRGPGHQVLLSPEGAEVIQVAHLQPPMCNTSKVMEATTAEEEARQEGAQRQTKTVSSVESQDISLTNVPPKSNY